VIAGAAQAEGLPSTWPSDFARSAADRNALLVLMSLPTVTARTLLVLAAGAYHGRSLPGGRPCR
jgi:hypothetical protein